MKDRAAGRRIRAARRDALHTFLNDADFFPRLARAVQAMTEAIAGMSERFAMALAEAARQVEFSNQLRFPSLSVPVEPVIDGPEEQES